MFGYVCYVGGSCIWWFMMLISGFLVWGGCLVGVLGIGYSDGVVVIVVLWVFGCVCRCGGG